jgi:hypothetical protein
MTSKHASPIALCKTISNTHSPEKVEINLQPRKAGASWARRVAKWFNFSSAASDFCEAFDTILHGLIKTDL